MKGYVIIFLSVLFWGLWGFSGKIATRYNGPMAITSVSYFIFPVYSILIFYVMKQRGETINFSWPGIATILLTSLFAFLGSFAYYVALSKAPASMVVSLTAIYPAVTVVLALAFLGESFTLIQAAGLMMILAGTVMVGGH